MVFRRPSEMCALRPTLPLSEVGLRSLYEPRLMSLSLRHREHETAMTIRCEEKIEDVSPGAWRERSPARCVWVYRFFGGVKNGVVG